MNAVGVVQEAKVEAQATLNGQAGCGELDDKRNIEV